MKAAGGDGDFEATIGPGGTIRVPPRILRRLGSHAGSRMIVRLTPGVIAAALGRKGVTPGDVDRIAALQHETKEQVIAFLLAEGALAGAGRATRRTTGRTKK